MLTLILTEILIIIFLLLIIAAIALFYYDQQVVARELQEAWDQVMASTGTKTTKMGGK